MNYSEAKKVLEANGQGYVLDFWGKLGVKARKSLLAQIATIDFTELARCRSMLPAFVCSKAEKPCVKRVAAPTAPKVAELKGKAYASAVTAGAKELSAGRVGVLLVAGGQGSRLGYEGPKGAYPIGPVTDKPLFHFHARKVLAKTLKYGKSVPFYVMTSEANYDATVACFKENGWFGLDRKDIFFFKQGMWPGMTEDGKIILDEPGHVFMSPDGHGGLLAALKNSGALADMKKRGVKSVFFFQVDNPLVEIADEAFIGYHVQSKSEYSLKLCAKRDPFEKVGMPMKFGNVCKMVEYTEMTDEQCKRKGKDGKLYFLYGSPAIHVFDRAFLEREAMKPMPLHLAHKKIAYLDDNGEVVKPSAPNAYKFEKFIFDILPDAKKVAFLAFDQKEEFSPVKNAEGSDSPATCKADMQAKWRRQLAERGILIDGDAVLEVDPCSL
ncbi:MAG: UTP--glucose-1-phosphate uridylyltransferase [Kiritimatiellae bacterium]|nr:UTP--glucose-1-phosphate uridylyltransferase [Kiritimatiellia bacterium]